MQPSRMSSIHQRSLAMAARRAFRLSGLIAGSVQGPFTVPNSVRLCGRDVDGKWSDVATRQSASIGPLSTLHPYQEGSHRRVEYRRSTKVDKAQGQAPIPQGAWRSTICEDPPPKNKKQPQRQSPKPRREASARNPPSQESHPIPSLLCLFSSRRH